ncbi:hypothetical protein GCM10027570_40320 [Streptomonospora sediminis]
MSAPRWARVCSEVAVHAAGGALLERAAEDQVWAACCADRAWLLAADVVSLRHPGCGPQQPPAGPDRLARGAPACRVRAVAVPRPAVIVDGSGADLPARSGWDARLLGSLAHSWLSAGLDLAELARAWPVRTLTDFQAAAARRSVAVSLRLGTGAAHCRWTALY